MNLHLAEAKSFSTALHDSPGMFVLLVIVLAVTLLVLLPAYVRESRKAADAYDAERAEAALDATAEDFAA